MKKKKIFPALLHADDGAQDDWFIVLSSEDCRARQEWRGSRETEGK